MNKKKTVKAPAPAAQKTAVAIRPESVGSIDAGALIQRAIDKNVPIETMEKLLAMRRELKAEWAKEQFFADLARFQKECPIIIKKEGVSFGNSKEPTYKYAPLEAIVVEVRDLLEKYGFSYTLKPRQTEGEITQVCVVHHLAGHTEETEFSVPIDKSGPITGPQKVGSANTYAKRYAFCNAFGIMTGDEDDDARPRSEDKQSGPRVVTPEPTLSDARQKVSRKYIELGSSKFWTHAELQTTWSDRMNEAKDDAKALYSLEQEMDLALKTRKGA